MGRGCTTNMENTKMEDIYAYNNKIISCSTDVSEEELQCVVTKT